MARRPDTSKYETFADARTRLDEIVSQVRRKDVSLETSLDLFDEAIAIVEKAVSRVDTEPATTEERAQVEDEVASAEVADGS